MKHLNFYDIVLDFILMDSFEDLENPPISIQNVINNRWLNSSFKETVRGVSFGCRGGGGETCWAGEISLQILNNLPVSQAVASSCWSVMKQKRQHMKVHQVQPLHVFLINWIRSNVT